MNSQPAAIVIPIVAYMAANPDDGLTAEDMALKFGFKARTAPYYALRRLVDEGWVSKESSGQKKRGRMPEMYSAGPKLLALVGRAHG